MILKVVYLFIIYMFMNPFLIELGLMPDIARWGVEALAFALFPVILVRLAINKKIYVKPRFLILIFITLLSSAISFVYNQSSASALIIGLKHHFKFLPFFLLPLVYDFSEKEIKKILFLLCGLLALQSPVSLIQRFIWHSDVYTGDGVTGTISSSGSLSVILVSAISISYSFFVAKRIKFKSFAILSMLFLIPTIINETKITFFLIPYSLAISTFLYDDENVQHKVKKITIFFLSTVIFLSVFMYTYEFLYGRSDSGTLSILSFIEREKKNKGYIYLGNERAAESIEAGDRIGRMDAIIFSFKNIAKDPGKLFFGISIGNTLAPSIGLLIYHRDENVDRYWPSSTTISFILWELGMIGLSIHCIFLVLVFKDAFSMKDENTFMGALCLAWCSIIAIMFLALFYQNVFNSNPVHVTYWFLTGIVLSKTYKHRSSAPSHACMLVRECAKR